MTYCQELDKQVLKHLQNQAAVAAMRYQAEHDTDLKLNEVRAAYTRKREVKAASDRHTAEIVKTETGFEGETAKLREVEAELDKLRQDHYTETDQLTAAQAGIFETNAEIGEARAGDCPHLGDNRSRLEAADRRTGATTQADGANGNRRRPHWSAGIE